MRNHRLHLRILLVLIICVLCRTGTTTHVIGLCSNKAVRTSFIMRSYDKYESIEVILRTETCCVSAYKQRFARSMCYNACLPDSTPMESKYEILCRKSEERNLYHVANEADEWFKCNLTGAFERRGTICPDQSSNDQWEFRLIFKSGVSSFILFMGICDHSGTCITASIKSSTNTSSKSYNIHRKLASGKLSIIDRVVVFLPLNDAPALQSITLANKRRSLTLYRNLCTDKCHQGWGFVSINATLCMSDERNSNESYYRALRKFGCQPCDCLNSECDIVNGNVVCVSDYCPVIKSDKYPQYLYDLTLNQHNVTIICAKGTLVRHCAGNTVAKWKIEIDNDCTTDTQLLHDVDTAVTKGNLSEEEVEEAVDNLDALATIAASNKSVSRKLLKIVGNLMKTDKKTLANADKNGNGGEKVRSIMENFSSKMKISDGVSKVIATGDISVGAYSTVSQTNKTFTIITQFREVTTSTDETVTRGPVVMIPSEITTKLNQENQHRIQVIAYRNSKLFSSYKSVSQRVSSAVITVIVNRSFALNLSHSDDAVLMYRIQRNTNDTGNFKCVYWDAELRDWSPDGMAEAKDEIGDKLCKSTHLSSFSILLDTDSSTKLSDQHERYLTYISYIGCGLSIVGLLATIFTFALFKNLHGDNSGKIFLNICVSMLLLNTIFLLGSLDSESYDVGICMAVAVSTHYFLLTTLVWMMIEAFDMYQKLITVFTKRNRWSMTIRMLAGWGTPLVVVGTTLALSTENYKPSNQFCFLTHTNKVAFFAAVIAPASIILLINTYVFIRVLIIVLRQFRSGVKQPTSSQSSLSLAQVRGAMSVMIVLGITWVFGPLAIGPAKVVFAYLFAILNSLQGFLLFVFRCIFNKEAVVSWKLFISTGRRKQKRGVASYATTSTDGWRNDIKQSRNMSTTPSDSSWLSMTSDTFGGAQPADKRHIILPRSSGHSSVSYVIHSIEYANESGGCKNYAGIKRSNDAEARLTDYLRSVIDDKVLLPGKNSVKKAKSAPSGKFSEKVSMPQFVSSGKGMGTKTNRDNMYLKIDSSGCVGSVAESNSSVEIGSDKCEEFEITENTNSRRGSTRPAEPENVNKIAKLDSNRAIRKPKNPKRSKKNT